MAHRHQVLAVVEHPAPDSGTAGLRQRVVEQPVRPAGVVVLRAQVVGPLEEVGIDLLAVDELLELDDVGAVARGRGDLVLLQHHVLPAGPLVAHHDLLVGDLLALLGAHAPLVQPLAVGGVDLMEVDRPVLERGEDLHRDRDPAEHDRPVPDRPWHRSKLPGARPGKPFDLTHA